MYSTTAHVLRSLQELVTSASNGALAAITARAGAKCSTTLAGAAVTARAGATYFTGNAGTASNAMSSRVPGPTVDRRVSVNSGTERKEPQNCVFTTCHEENELNVCWTANSSLKFNLTGHRSTHGPLGTNEAISNDGDTCSRHEAELH